jgi:succinate dehydrogenase / fumarate reductase membrane anchor subunit
VILAVWFVVALLSLGTFEYEAVLAWLRSPLNAVLLVLLIGTVVYHSMLGVQVVLEDYVPSKGLKVISLLLINFLHVALGALGIFAVLRIAFGGAA